MKNQNANRQDISDETHKSHFICTYKQKPLFSDKLLKCHNPFCRSGKFFLKLQADAKQCNDKFGMYGV